MTHALQGTPRYFAWLYSSERMQAILKPLFAIEEEINAALRPGLEHAVAHVRLAWWDEEAQRLRGGRALHPLTRALLAQCPSGTDVSGLVDVARWDLAGATFETGKELAGYCDRWAHAMTQLAATGTIRDDPAQRLQRFGHGLGVALCELDMLVSLQRCARLGRLRIPLDELAALGVAPEALGHTPWPPHLSARVRERHRQLRGALSACCAQLRTGAARVELRGLLVWAALMQEHSRRAEQALPRSWRRSRWSGIGDAMRAWRAARNAMRRGARHHPL